MDEFLFEVDRIFALIYFTIFAGVLHLIMKITFKKLMKMSKPLENEIGRKLLTADEPSK